MPDDAEALYKPGEVAPAHNPKEAPPVAWAHFLEHVPPGEWHRLQIATTTQPNTAFKFKCPLVQLYCPEKHCSAVQFFEPASEEIAFYWGHETTQALTYRCRNCTTFAPTYYLRVIAAEQCPRALKIGQWPLFDVKTPARTLRLIQTHLELFNKGRKAERYGLGIGAFGYYRRVVEGEWQHLLDEILQVSIALNEPAENTEIIRAAKAQHQFQKAVEMVKDALPAQLLIEGQNPITLLYRCTSVGIHKESDKWCLEKASAVREVLTELSERMHAARAERKQLREALVTIAKLQDT